MLDAPDVVTEEEGSVITACVSIVGNVLIEREITVTFSTINGAQQGTVVTNFSRQLARTVTKLLFLSDVTDFVPITEVLSFDPVSPTDPQCRTVTIINDNILEDDEVIQILIESSDSAVIISNPSVNVTIIDIDSEFHD